MMGSRVLRCPAVMQSDGRGELPRRCLRLWTGRSQRSELWYGHEACCFLTMWNRA